MSDSPVLQGLSMPVHGLDHLLLSITVGFLAVRVGGRNGLIVAGTHLAGLVAGAVVNFAGAESPALTYGIPIMASLVAVALSLRQTSSRLAVGLGALLTLGAGLLNAGAMVTSVRDALGSTSAAFLLSTLIGCSCVTALGALLASITNMDALPKRSSVAALVILVLTAASVLSPDLNEAIIRLIEN
jgi:urease accessory protein